MTRHARGWASIRRAIQVSTAGAAVVALAVVGAASPAEASPQQKSRERAAATLVEVRSAAAEAIATADEARRPSDPVAKATLEPGKGATLAADELGASLVFSGHDVSERLTLTAAEPAASAARVAQAETAGTVVSRTVEITAVTASGDPVTSFPAKVVETRGGGAESEPPVATDVLPGVSLELDVDRAVMEKNGIDEGSLRIFTRETAGDPWTVLPSYYDTQSKTVKGESDHLSQFVVIGTPFAPAAGPTIVLDPDDDDARTTAPWIATELPYNIALAQGVAAMMQERCLARVTVLPHEGISHVSWATRAGMAAAANPELTVTLAFNSLYGHAWGEGPSEGGTHVYSRGGSLDDAATASLIGEMPGYTGRPARQMPSNADFPHPEFAVVPGAMTHLEALFLDNNWDQPVIANGFGSIVNGVFTGLGRYLESQGFDCSDPVTGGWPAKPSQAELERWRNLGHQNFQTYGAEPVSFSTGNLIEDEKLFTLTGSGGQALDLALTYNSQDGRLTRTGAGWSFGLGARTQRFDDGSVLVVRGDGASFVFESNGAGGYVTERALNQTLVEAGGGMLRLSDVSGESWLFDAGDVDGIGELVAQTDRRGNTTTLTYGPADGSTQQFVPLTAITDQAGQTITVQNDGAGRITGFTHPDGRTWSLGYDGAGNLVSITQPDGRVRSFTYDGSHQLVTATDAKGVTYLTNEYDASGRVVNQWDANGNRRSFDYSKAGQTTYTNNEGAKTVFHFDATFRITKIVDALGNDVTFTFDDRSQVMEHVDERGRATAYVYDDRGNVVSQTRPDGSIVKYTYTPTGEVASKTDLSSDGSAARTTSFDFDELGRPTTVHQPDGTLLTTEYDGAGNVVATTSGSGARTSFRRDGRGNLTSVSDPDGNTTVYTYDTANRVTSVTDANGSTTMLEWDAADRLAAQTDALGGVTVFEYDPNDHLARQTDPDGAVTSYTWDDMFDLVEVTAPDGAVTSYTYNTENTLASVRDALGNATSFLLDDLNRAVAVTDPNGGVWERTYDKTGTITSTKDPAGGVVAYRLDAFDRVVKMRSASGAESSTRFDQLGRVILESGPEGTTTSYTYDALDRVTKATDAAGKSVRFEYDADGNLIVATDRLGNATVHTYSAAGRLLTVTDPTGALTKLTYDGVGNVTAITDPLGRTTKTSYDELSRMSESADPLGNITSFDYDAMGRRIAVTDPLGQASRAIYDLAGRLTSVSDPAGGVVRYGYDAVGNQTSVIDALGTETRYAYDPAGQLTKIVEGFVNGSERGADVNVISTFSYDSVGNRTAQTDPNGNATRFEYDAEGRVLREINAAGTAWHYEYDNAGRLIAQRDGNGQTSRFSYTRRGDLARAGYPGASVEFEYDADQRLIAMTDPLGVSGWTYDEVGRLVKQIDANGEAVIHAYDAAGQLSALTVPGGEQIEYVYDDASRMIEQSSPWGLIDYAWDAASKLSAQTRSTGVTSAYGYDSAGRVTSIAHQTPAPSVAEAATATDLLPDVKRGPVQKCAGVGSYLSDRTLQPTGGNGCVKTWEYLDDRTLPVAPNPVADGDRLSFTYDYDLAGNVTSASREVGTAAERRDFAYDALNRLIGSVSSIGEKNAYTYDAAGNRTSASRVGTAANTSTTATFNALNQVTNARTTDARGTTDASFRYDGNGDRVGQTAAGVDTRFTYDATGRMTAVSRDGRSTTYGYDGLGRQLTSTDTTSAGAQTTTQAWDGLAQLQRTNPVSGITTLMRDALGELAAEGTSTGARWALLDRLGSTVAQTEGASITQLAGYDDWGTPDFESAGWSASLGFTGETTDPGWSLNQYYSRTYDPATASWTSPDSWRGLLTEPQTLHRYAYVTNAPITQFDRFGYWGSWSDWAIVGGAILGGAVVVAAAAGCVASVVCGVAAAVGAGLGAAIAYRVTSANPTLSGTASMLGEGALSAVPGGLLLKGARVGIGPLIKSPIGFSPIFTPPIHIKSKTKGVAPNPVKPSSIESIKADFATMAKGDTYSTVKSSMELQKMFKRWTQGAAKEFQGVTDGKYLERYRLPDGTTVQFRNISRTGGWTIDIVRGEEKWNIHIVP